MAAAAVAVAIVALSATIPAAMLEPEFESNDAKDETVAIDDAATGCVTLGSSDSRVMPQAADVVKTDDVDTDCSRLVVELSSAEWCEVLSVVCIDPPVLGKVEVVLVKMLLSPAALLMFWM